MHYVQHWLSITIISMLIIPKALGKQYKSPFWEIHYKLRGMLCTMANTGSLNVLFVVIKIQDELFKFPAFLYQKCQVELC